MGRLLVLACSERKRLDSAPLPAIERYDGPTFRVLRRYLQSQPTDPPALYVLSAELGLIEGNRPIPHYDRQMTAQRASELRPLVTTELKRALEAGCYQTVLIVVGRAYLQALSASELAAVPGVTLRLVSGGFGRRVAELFDWLNTGSSQLYADLPKARLRGRAQLHGVDVELTSDQVLEVARLALTEGRPEAARYHSWYVPVDGLRIAPKWLVSQLTGLPLRSFVTGDARRVLADLGVEVCRTQSISVDAQVG